MQCPKCKKESSSAIECEFCGIIFAKYQALVKTTDISSTHSINAQKESVISYVGLYALLYYICVVAMSIINSIFGLYAGSIAIPYIVAGYTATKFVKSRGRLITRIEKIKLIAGTFVCTVLANLLIFISPRETAWHTGTAAIGVAFILTLFNLLSLILVFGPISTHIYNSVKK